MPVVETQCKLVPVQNLEPAVADWTAFGLSAGIRRSEWMQPDAKHSDIRKPELKDHLGIVGAFLPCDWQFYDIKGRKLSHHDVHLGGLPQLAKLKVTWRTQKNGKNYESKTYTPNKKNPQLCPIARGYSILMRYIDLVGLSDENKHVPLAVYKDYNASGVAVVRLIYSDQVTQLIRNSASAVLNLDPVKDKEELSRFSSHSLRVGACQILYAY